MLLCDYFKRRWPDRFGGWTITVLALLCLFLLSLNSIWEHYEESWRQERYRSYLQDVVNSDVDVMGKLRQQVVDLAKHRSIKILETSSKDFQVYLFGFKSFKRGFWDVCLRNFNVRLPTGFLYSPSSSNVTLSWCSTAP